MSPQQPGQWAKMQPEIYTGMTGVQMAMAAFATDHVRPWRASCVICNNFHVAAADKDQARHIILGHADKMHTIADVWKAGEI